MSRIKFRSHTAYRHIYESATNEQLPTNFDVHHIDGNRENCTVVNMVAIPKTLHKDYHKYKPLAEKFVLDILPKNGNLFIMHDMAFANRWFNIINDMCHYVNVRDHLLGYGPLAAPRECHYFKNDDEP